MSGPSKTKTPILDRKLESERLIQEFAPKEFVENYCAKKPIGVRVHKQDCRITQILPESSLVNKVFIGDTILSVDQKPIVNGDELQQKLKEQSNRVLLEIRHIVWSWCFHLRTTVEKFKIDRETEKITSNPVNHYYVLIKIKRTPENPNNDFGLFIKYSNRDRLEIANVKPDSIFAVHLRPGDVIRECNNTACCSKSMLRYLISNSIETSGQISFLIEAPVSDGRRDHIDVSDDVISMADKQIEEFKKTLKSQPNIPSSMQKEPSSKNRIRYSNKERTEHEIVSDVDPTRLKPCKNAN